MRLHELYQRAIKIIWGEHATNQRQFLSVLGDVRDLKADTLQSVGAFFVPNNDYMKLVFGEEIELPEFGCYYNGICSWNRQFVFPVCDVNGLVVAFYGFNPDTYLESKETREKGLNYYSSSSSHVFKKSRFLYIPQNCYTKALDEGYLFVVDGLFDCISLWEAGFNAGALLGSNLSDEIVMQLRFVDRVILIADNDEAGSKLYRSCLKRLSNIELFKQGLTKDVDELLHQECREETIKSLEQTLSHKTAIHRINTNTRAFIT